MRPEVRKGDNTMMLKLDYYYGNEAEQYTFFRIPKLLFTDSRYAGISVEAKVLYGLLLDRMGLSMKNGWLDEEGRVYIIFTIADIKAMLGCAEQKANKLLRELDSAGGIGLIERRRRGLGKPNVIYVKNFTGTNGGGEESQIKKCENHNSGSVKTTKQELRYSQTNDTDINETEVSETHSSIPHPASGKENAAPDGGKMETLMERIREQIDYGILLKRHPYDRERLDGFVELIAEVYGSASQTMRINREKIQTDLVKNRLQKLTCDHIEYVMRCLDENPASISNMRGYMLSALFNAPVTISQYYASLYSHDMANGFYDDPAGG